MTGMRILATLLVLSLAPVGCAEVVPTSARRFTASGEIIALSGGAAGADYACIACHGLDGAGNGAGAPRLAGLDAGYLQRQLDAYADGRRHHALMRHVALRLDDDARQAVSGFYAGRPFVQGGAPSRPPHPLYVRGDPDRGLQACAYCHGWRGEGGGPAVPPLGAQPAPYLAEQLKAWSLSGRRNDPLDVMQVISRRLRPAEREAVAAYAASLPGGPQRPVYPAAFPAARRDDPKNGASAPRSHAAAR